MSEITINQAVSCAQFVARAEHVRAAYRAGEITYTQLRRELDAAQPVSAEASARQQCRMAMAWLRKARAAGKALMWWEHAHYMSAARRSIETIASPVWRARMTRAANAVEMMAKLEDPR
jgi:hypothetical protein